MTGSHRADRPGENGQRDGTDVAIRVRYVGSGDRHRKPGYLAEIFPSVRTVYSDDIAFDHKPALVAPLFVVRRPERGVPASGVSPWGSVPVNQVISSRSSHPSSRIDRIAPIPTIRRRRFRSPLTVRQCRREAWAFRRRLHEPMASRAPHQPRKARGISASRRSGDTPA